MVHCTKSTVFNTLWALQIKFHVVPGESWFQFKPLKCFFFLQSDDRNRTILEIAVFVVFYAVYVNFRAKCRDLELRNRVVAPP